MTWYLYQFVVHSDIKGSRPVLLSAPWSCYHTWSVTQISGVSGGRAGRWRWALTVRTVRLWQTCPPGSYELRRIHTDSWYLEHTDSGYLEQRQRVPGTETAGTWKTHSRVEIHRARQILQTENFSSCGIVLHHLAQSITLPRMPSCPTNTCGNTSEGSFLWVESGPDCRSGLWWSTEGC